MLTFNTARVFRLQVLCEVQQLLSREQAAIPVEGSIPFSCIPLFCNAQHGWLVSHTFLTTETLSFAQKCLDVDR